MCTTEQAFLPSLPAADCIDIDVLGWWGGLALHDIAFDYSMCVAIGVGLNGIDVIIGF